MPKVSGVRSWERPRDERGRFLVRELEWIEPLLWMDPPFAIIQRIIGEVRRVIPFRVGACGIAGPLGRQRHNSLVFAEVSRRLRIYDIAVEGENW